MPVNDGRMSWEEDVKKKMAEKEAVLMAKVKAIKRMVIYGVLTLGVIVGFLWGNPLVTVDSGHRGVVTRFGAVQPIVLEEGLSIVRPFTDRVHEIDVQIHKYEVPASAASKDQQDVKTVVAVNYQVIPSDAWWIYKELRGDHEARVIAPAVQEVVKAATAKFDAAELIRNREIVKDMMKTALTTKLHLSHLNVLDVSIVNFEFSAAYTQAIESKQVAEQNAQKERNQIETAKMVAQQTIETAKAQAESLRLQREQITPMMLEKMAIEKWDGVLPAYMGGGATPFIDVSKLKKQ